MYANCARDYDQHVVQQCLPIRRQFGGDGLEEIFLLAEEIKMGVDRQPSYFRGRCLIRSTAWVRGIPSIGQVIVVVEMKRGGPDPRDPSVAVVVQKAIE